MMLNMMRCVSELPYLLDLELLLSLGDVAACSSFGALDLGCGTSICHLDVGHGGCDVFVRGVVCSEAVFGLCGVADGSGGVRMIGDTSSRAKLF